MDFITAILLALNVLNCHGASLLQQLQHVVKTHAESNNHQNENEDLGYRRFISFHPGHQATILGAPSRASHLPEAEPILPGHTLIRPALGMLKSAIKFPHKDWNNGAGVYGNIDKLGITWGGTNERVLYTGFRRNQSPRNYATYSRYHGKNSPLIIIVLKYNNKNRNQKKHKSKNEYQYGSNGDYDYSRNEKSSLEKSLYSQYDYVLTSLICKACNCCDVTLL